jgi:hypothetical protein
MKLFPVSSRYSSRRRLALVLFCWGLPGASLFQSTFTVRAVRAQAPTPRPAALLPALEVSPSVLGRDATVTLRTPAEWPLSTSALRVAIFEAGRPTRLGERLRDWQMVNGRLQTTVRVEAEPGVYELRLVSSDKARNPINLPATLLVPGVERVPGWRLFNGSPFVAPAGNNPTEATDPALPLFLPGLRRQSIRSGKELPDITRWPSAQPLRWQVVTLPALQSMIAEKWDAETARQRVTAALAPLRESGARGLAGFSCAVTAAETGLTEDEIRRTVRSLRGAIDSVAPEAALLLTLAPGEVSTAPIGSTSNSPEWRVLQAAAPLSDGVVLQVGRSSGVATLWATKIARRIAEEQPSYDLPIWLLQTEDESLHPVTGLELWMSGASGLIGQPPAWASLVRRNWPLFAGSVTLEDTGLLPQPLEENTGGALVPPLFSRLRDIGRIPLLARASTQSRARNAESFLVRLGSDPAKSTLQGIESAARGGARVYVEGAARPADAAAQTLVNQLFPATVTPVTSRRSAMTLADVWTFGTAAGQRLPVQQTVTVQLKPTPTPAKPDKNSPRPQRGLDVLTEPRIVAKLEDGSPGVVVLPLGRGEIVWMPHEVLFPAGEELNPGPAQQFYAAMAGYLQPALVQVRRRPNLATNASETTVLPEATLPQPIAGVRVALRASARGTLLVSLFNSSQQPHSLAVEASVPANIALDLGSETELPVRRRGGTVTIDVDLPADGWKLLALGTTRQALESERDAATRKARLR